MQNVIDQLGVVNRRISELEEIAGKLKKELLARGIGKYEGEKFTAEVKHYDRTQISPALVRELADKDFVSMVTEVRHVESVIVRAIA